MSAPSRFGFSSTSRVVRWSIYNVGVMACAWFALAEGRLWADNILSFITVAYSVISIACLGEAAQKSLRKTGRSVPVWLSTSTDMAIMLGCAAEGRFWLAGCWLWIMIAEQIAYGNKEDTQ